MRLSKVALFSGEGGKRGDGELAGNAGPSADGRELVRVRDGLWRAVADPTSNELGTAVPGRRAPVTNG